MRRPLIIATLLVACGGQTVERERATVVARSQPEAPAPAAPAPVAQQPAAAGAEGTFQLGPPFGHVWCLRENSFWSEELRRSHFPADATAEAGPANDSCSAAATVTWPSGMGVIVVACGEHVTGEQGRDLNAAVRDDPEVGARLTVEHYPDKKLGTVTMVVAWDRDTPCRALVKRYGPDAADNERRARMLTRDVLAKLTPQSIARPRAELVYTAEDTTGDAARAVLAGWAERKPAVDFVAPLAPGYPRIARSDEFPGLAKGKQFLLLGICRSEQGRRLQSLLMAVLPPRADDPKPLISTVHLHNVDGLGLPVACPAALTDEPATEFSGSTWKDLPDGRVHGVIAAIDRSVAGGEVFARVASLLFSKDLRVLDIATVEVKRPLDDYEPGKPGSHPTLRYDNCGAALHSAASAYGMGCDLYRGDKPCLGQPHRWTHSETFLVRGDELKVESSEGTREGSMCRVPE